MTAPAQVMHLRTNILQQPLVAVQTENLFLAEDAVTLNRPALVIHA